MVSPFEEDSAEKWRNGEKWVSGETCLTFFSFTPKISHFFFTIPALSFFLLTKKF